MILIKSEGILRSAIYAVVAIQAFILSYIYYFGYEKIKHTPIIRMLCNFFLALALFFSYATFLAITDVLDKPIHEFVSKMSFIFCIPLVYFMYKFRELSSQPKEKEVKTNGTKSKKQSNIRNN